MSNSPSQHGLITPERLTIMNDNKSFIIIDCEELQALIETAELLQEPDILIEVSQAREDYQKGETLTMEDIFD
jgi:antitoxin YefM